MTVNGDLLTITNNHDYNQRPTTNDVANFRKLKTIHTTNFLGFRNIQSKTRVAKYGDNATKTNHEYNKQRENYYARINKELQLMAMCG